MAYKQAEKKEHDFKSISRDVKNDQIANVVLLCGKEQYLIDWSVNLILNKYIPDASRELDYTRIEPEQFELDGMIEACETLSMLSQARVVAAPDFPPLAGGKLKGFSEEDEQRLIDYIREIPDGNILIFTCEKPDKRRKLYREIEKVGRVYEFGSLEEKDLINFIAKRFRLAKKTCKGFLIKEMIELSGYYHKETEYTLYNLENDLRKMIAHSSGDEIIATDVLAAVSGNLETNVFAMVDSVSRGKKDEAYKLLFNILGAGESVYRLLSMLVSQFELILQAKELKSEGMGQAAIAKRLDAHEFRVKKALSFSERYSEERLRKILISAYGIDADIKKGILEQRLAMELFIAEI